MPVFVSPSVATNGAAAYVDPGYGYGYGAVAYVDPGYDYGYGTEYTYGSGASTSPRGLSVRKPGSDQPQPQLANVRESA